MSRRQNISENRDVTFSNLVVAFSLTDIGCTCCFYVVVYHKPEFTNVKSVTVKLEYVYGQQNSVEVFMVEVIFDRSQKRDILRPFVLLNGIFTGILLRKLFDLLSVMRDVEKIPRPGAGQYTYI